MYFQNDSEKQNRRILQGVNTGETGYSSMKYLFEF